MSAPAIRHPRQSEQGFTLVELLVVLAIIGLLTTVVVINVLPMQGRAQVQKAEADIALIEQGLEFWRIDMGRYPTPEEGLAVLTAPGMTGAKLKNTDCARADLRQAILQDADLSRANFTGAQLKQVNITGARRGGARGLSEVI